MAMSLDSQDNLAQILEYGTNPYKQQLSPSQIESINFVLPFMTNAVKRAEGSNKYIKSYSSKNPERDLKNSIVNNFARWIQAGGANTPNEDDVLPYVRFMRQRWAPFGVANDPNNLNYHWTENVRRALFEMLGGNEFNRWKKYNMV